MLSKVYTTSLYGIESNLITKEENHSVVSLENREDYADVIGQDNIKRALTIAAAGCHDILMTGPPGAGKTMQANSFNSRRSVMTKSGNYLESEIKREITKLYKSSFGKGPETIEAIIYKNFVFLKFIGAFPQIEERILHSEWQRNCWENNRRTDYCSNFSLYSHHRKNIKRKSILN